MARAGRLDAPGAIHHVITRGLAQATIFRDNADYTRFLHRAGLVFESSKTSCHAWALMPNHVHFLLATGSMPISRVMQKLLTGYAVTYNYRWKRRGHLFQGRYKSLLCEKEAYLQELVRYIHLNPARAGLCEGVGGLSRYPWTGHRALLGLVSVEWQDTETVLEMFGGKTGPAREAYSRFCAEGLLGPADGRLRGEGLKRLAEGGWEVVRESVGGNEEYADERILGSRAFVERALREAEEQERIRSRLKRSGVTIDAVLKQAALKAGVGISDVIGSGKRPGQVLARALSCYWLVERLGYTEMKVARRLGITQPAVSQNVLRGRRLASERKHTLNLGEGLERRIL